MGHLRAQYAADGGWSSAPAPSLAAVPLARSARSHRVPTRPAGSSARPPVDALDDAVARMRRGDEEAFREVYRAVQPRLLRYLGVLVDRADAEDVASETWLQVTRDLSGFEGDGVRFRAWVSTIARHRALDHLRARRRRPAAALADELPDRPSAELTDAAALESLSTAAAVALLATLPAEQAEAVMLRAVMGLDARTAGHVLGRSPGAVRTAAHRGLRTLAARLPADLPAGLPADLPAHVPVPAPARTTRPDPRGGHR